MRDWPMPRICCNSATESSSCSRSSSSRRRVGSASNRNKLMVDAMDGDYDISTHHDWSICPSTLLHRCSVESRRRWKRLARSTALTLQPFNALTLIMSRRYIFSSESVGEGHPDKVCDAISDAVLDACIEQDRHSRVACETYAKSNIVIVGGEITIPTLPEEKPLESLIPISQIVRETVREIGYINDDDVFHADRIAIQNIITKQSPDIAQGVDACAAEGKETAEQGAGDQGLMFGYACDETPELMPSPIMYAHRLGRELTRIRKSGKVGWLRPDAKSQVSVVYDDGKPIAISCVVVSTQHTRDVKHSEIRSFVIEEVIKKVLPKQMLSEETQ